MAQSTNTATAKTYAYAIEQARIARGESRKVNAGTDRFSRLADYLIGEFMANDGAACVLRYDVVNKGFGGNRTTGTEGNASWAALVSRFNGQLGGAMPFTVRVDKTVGAIVLTPN